MKDSYRNTNAHLIFLEELSKQEGELSAILNSKVGNIENNVEDLRNSIHKLKGSADFFNYEQLGAVAKKLEKQSVKSKISIENLFPLHDEIKNILNSICEYKK